jgi:hypothetical protein
MARWFCRCGVKGIADSRIGAFREWRQHHNGRHAGTITGDQLRVAVERAA